MRGICAGVIETMIILDRWLYLHENMTEGYLGVHRLFNPSISPRGWAIVALRVKYYTHQHSTQHKNLATIL